MNREEAIKWLKDYRKNTDFEMPQYEKALEMAIQALSQEQKSGKWIVDAPHYVCSECNYVHHLQRFEVMSGCKLGNFCPNCGSAMKGE